MTTAEGDIDQSLADVVARRLSADDTLADDVAYLVLAALESDDALRDQLDGSGPPVAAPAGSSTSVAPAEPIGAFLDSIEVQGFRGIGASTRLDVHPAPGITVISGRNGSGKSSFAEALEFALTGRSYRFQNKSKTWADTWRNLHADVDPSVRLAFTVEGSEQTVVGADWKPDAALTDGRVWVQVGNKPRSAGVASLGWGSAIDLHRPILTYDEIGGLLVDNPSVLHDALSNLLGLDEITAAEKRLTDAHKAAKVPRTEADSLLREVRSAVATSDDPRAVSVASELARRPFDLDVIDRALSESDPAAVGHLDALRALAKLRVPTLDDVQSAAEDLRAAIERHHVVADASAQLAQSRLAVLQAAIAYRDGTGEDDCPVCGTGTLDDEWRSGAADLVEQTTQGLADFRRSDAARSQAVARARSLLASIVVPEAADGVDPAVVESARTAAMAARAAPAADTDLPSHLESAVIDVIDTVTPLTAAAQVQVDAVDTSWKPIARVLRRWRDAEDVAVQAASGLTAVAAAKNWMSTNALALRNERLEPIAEQARQIWSELRQESNVDIGAITLTGRSTQRRVVFDGSVDGQPAGALSVMSQGELHALALALFIPRATTATSPFRFVVLDDPIQAMDPAKIDGFLRVLSGLATTRQIIVFSHDDRLATAIRTSGLDARLIEVTREAGSVVVTKESIAPAHRYADDAKILLRDENVPDAVKRRAVPTLFRMAVESAAYQSYCTRMFRAGASREDVAAEWTKVLKTRNKVALALDRDPGDLGGWLSQRAWRGPTIRICNAGAHGDGGELTGSHIKDLRDLVDELLALT